MKSIIIFAYLISQTISKNNLRFCKEPSVSLINTHYFPKNDIIYYDEPVEIVWDFGEVDWDIDSFDKYKIDPSTPIVPSEPNNSTEPIISDDSDDPDIYILIQT